MRSSCSLPASSNGIACISANASGSGFLGTGARVSDKEAAYLAQLRAKARFIRVSPAGQKEAAPHDVVEVSTRASSA